MKNIVFVADNAGVFHQHGPVRRSEAQASSVAKALARRLGWVAVAAESQPAKASRYDGPTATQAATSPVWKDATLAAKWEAAKGAPRTPAAPTPQETKVRKPRAKKTPAAPVAAPATE